MRDNAPPDERRVRQTPARRTVMGEHREMLRAVGGRMATEAIETAGSLDQATLDALREGIAAVLAEQSSSKIGRAHV